MRLPTRAGAGGAPQGQAGSARAYARRSRDLRGGTDSWVPIADALRLAARPGAATAGLARLARLARVARGGPSSHPLVPLGVHSHMSGPAEPHGSYPTMIAGHGTR